MEASLFTTNAKWKRYLRREKIGASVLSNGTKDTVSAGNTKEDCEVSKKKKA